MGRLTSIALAQLRQILMNTTCSRATYFALPVKSLHETNSWTHRKYSSSRPEVKPPSPANDSDTGKPLQLTPELIHHLERTSLVDFNNIDGLRRLEQAVEFANQILEVDTTGVEPMSAVLEEIVLQLREDKPVQTNREDILSNASVTEDDYFVSPPGNIPLEAEDSSSKFRKY